MKRIVLIFFLFFFSLFLVSDSLNLVEIQKKEKERRKKLSKSKYVLTDDKLLEYSLKKSKTFVESDVVETTEVKKLKTKINNKEKTEQYWRSRLNIINKNIEGLRKTIRESQSVLNRESSNFLIASTPSLQQQIKMNIDRLTKQIRELKANLVKMEADKELFFREARKEGALPGWLR